MVFGNSITEGWLVADAQKYGRLLQNELGSEEVAVSGVGGAVTAGVLKRLQSELLKFKPKNVVVYIGTNTDSTYLNNIYLVLAVIRNVKANPIFCTIPTKLTETNIVKALPSDVKKVNFDLALTATGVGSALVTAFYTNTDLSGAPYTDSSHPNESGHLNMFRRFVIDTPDLFY